jgi:hypothetical protein
MRRLILIYVTLGIICVMSLQAQARTFETEVTPLLKQYGCD